MKIDPQFKAHCPRCVGKEWLIPDDESSKGSDVRLCATCGYSHFLTGEAKNGSFNSSMIDPTEIMIATPTYDGKVEVTYAGGLASVFSAHLAGTFTALDGISHVGLARDLIAHAFIKSSYNWLVLIDSDIGFNANDFRILCDFPCAKESARPRHEIAGDAQPTRDDDGNILLSVAEYARKENNAKPITFGLGFCKISREVFTRLDNLKTDDGAEALHRYRNQGREIVNYFPSGVLNSQWMGEDYGFFHLCRFAGIIPRRETRTNLFHHGRKQFPYITEESRP